MRTQLLGLLEDVAKILAEFLGRVLPEINPNWWEECVLNLLSPQQQRRVKEKRLDTVASLDLAGLLRVLDQNWYLIAPKVGLSSESRHYLKEMRTIRNRWAHMGTSGSSDEDTYRDLDTIQRLAAAVGADGGFLARVKECKSALIKAGESASSVPIDASGETEQAGDDAAFTMGQMVCFKSDPSQRGAVIGIAPGVPEYRYTLFIDGQTQTFYASQLQPEEQKGPALQFLPIEHFHSFLTALQIRHPSLSTLYSLNAARVDFIPYQFRPVLKFIRSDRPRLLIADSVGVGKTIEAGLILRELQARRDVRSVLIICPRPLVTERKWQIEMKRFEERFTHLDGSTLRLCITEMDYEAVWPEQHQKTIVPYSLFDEALLNGASAGRGRRRKKGLLDLDPPPRFDLVIVDEAHHIRNPETYAHKGVRFFCDNAEAVVFLTATPIQLGSDELYVLLNVLRPDLIIDRESFEHMAAPNPHINDAIAHARAQDADWGRQTLASLDAAAATAWGREILQRSPKFQRIRGVLENSTITREDRVEVISGLEELHTFSGIINRTRRRDIADDFPVRKPETVTVEFTPTQQHLHDELLNVQARILSSIHGDINLKFMMTTIRRQAASCIYGLAPLLETILTRRIDELSWDEADNYQEAPGQNTVAGIEDQILGVLEQASNLDPHDPKLEALCTILQNKQELSNNKVMLFSSFRHTLTYLHEHLLSLGYRVGLVHGGTPDEERLALRNRFRLVRTEQDALDILLFSEVGCEGLDYQFCDCIVNYDLPWNPMRIEQRIGRVDRKGQASDTVLIYNLITPGTVDADIYDRCLLRIGVFNASIGGSEEILGNITRELRDIAENIALTEGERLQKLEQLADNKIRLLREQEDLEQKQAELFGIRLPAERVQHEIEQASSYWLLPEAIKNLVLRYLEKRSDRDQEFILGEKPLKSLRLSQEMRNRLLQDFHVLPREASTGYREWENYLRGGNPHLLLTFDAATATEQPEANFIMPLHPLVRQAARALRYDGRVLTAIQIKDDGIPEGIYPFAIYQWQFHGIRDDLALCPVAGDGTVQNRLMEFLQKGLPAPAAASESLDSQVMDALDGQHYREWVAARHRHQSRTAEMSRYRRESLTISHRARLALLNEQLGQAADEKIQRMRRSQIASAESDYARRIQELDIAVERADITAEPVAFGVLKVVGGT